MITYTYGPGNGPLLTLSYGNGDSVSYTYDKYGRTATESHDTGTLSYTYNGERLLYGVTENNTKADDTSTYIYIPMTAWIGCSTVSGWITGSCPTGRQTGTMIRTS